MAGRRSQARLIFNRPLAAELLGLDVAAVEGKARGPLLGGGGGGGTFSQPDDAKPIAMAYAGHQFASLRAPPGDGRAIPLGELRQAVTACCETSQLKGSGLHRYSRERADGRAASGPMLREYLISEAMHALRIPTTRSLAVVTTGERVHIAGGCCRERCSPEWPQATCVSERS